ncbi:hypothetical protein P67b_00038 [Ruegeria phage Tedan]|nr:hypothetical protein P67b_00038 [Ruegeria phage Tedan]
MQNDKAIRTWMKHKVAIDTALERLTKHSAEMFETNPDDLHWGHVGDLARIEELLTKITDVTFEEGECA